VQSSSTSTSIIVALVSAGVEVRHAVPMIFGSNVGTSVTNTIVSMTQAGDRESFRRAFAAATVHDMFNWLTVVVMLILEISTGFLETLTSYMVDHMELHHNVSNPDILKPLTGPLTDLIVQMNKEVLMGWSFNMPEYANVTTALKKGCNQDGSPCPFLLAWMGEEGLGLNDIWLGLLLLTFSLVLLCGCLISLMKILNSMMGSQMATLIRKTINAEIPYVPWLTGYLSMLVGAVITILVRSSSVFTSTLTPLCGTGLVSLETAYPLTLGSNIGTTTTSILASFAAEGKYLKPSIQISLVHLFFNVVGILIFYPIPFMRWPVSMAQKLGDITAHYRWFAVIYLSLMFFILPALIFLLSLAGPIALYSFIIPTLVLIILATITNLLQTHKPHWLPTILKSWEFLPLWMHSLDPLDKLFSRYHFNS
jgi:sodium-dependent phosphate cotransporter